MLLKIHPHIIIIITTLSSSHYEHTLLNMLSIHKNIGSESNATSLNFFFLPSSSLFFFRYVAFFGSSLGRRIEVIIQ